MLKDEIVKSVPFRKDTINKIKKLSAEYKISGNSIVKYAVEKFLEEGGVVKLQRTKLKV